MNETREDLIGLGIALIILFLFPTLALLIVGIYLLGGESPPSSRLKRLKERRDKDHKKKGD